MNRNEIYFLRCIDFSVRDFIWIVLIIIEYMNNFMVMLNNIYYFINIYKIVGCKIKLFVYLCFL